MANNITQLCQQAAQAYLQGAGLSTVNAQQVYKGLDHEALKLPRVACQCKRAEIDLNFDGVWMAELVIIVRSNADDTTEEEHHLRAAEVFDNFMTRTIAEDLSDALAEFTASMVIPRRQAWDVTGGPEGNRSWVSELAMDVRCYGADIPELVPASAVTAEIGIQLDENGLWHGLLVRNNEDDEPTIYIEDNGAAILETLGIDVVGAGFRFTADGHIELLNQSTLTWHQLRLTNNEDGLPTLYLS